MLNHQAEVMESVRNKILSRCNLGAPEIGGGGLDDDLLDEDKICDDVSTAVAKVSPSDGNQMRGLYTPNHGDVLPGVTRAIITYTVSQATKDVLLASDDVLPCVTRRCVAGAGQQCQQRIACGHYGHRRAGQQ